MFCMLLSQCCTLHFNSLYKASILLISGPPASTLICVIFFSFKSILTASPFSSNQSWYFLSTKARAYLETGHVQFLWNGNTNGFSLLEEASRQVQHSALHITRTLHKCQTSCLKTRKESFTIVLNFDASKCLSIYRLTWLWCSLCTNSITDKFAVVTVITIAFSSSMSSDYNFAKENMLQTFRRGYLIFRERLHLI